ncbi:MAG: LysR family substrate-binding domain-containing protein [Gluconacetobacter sp.]
MARRIVRDMDILTGDRSTVRRNRADHLTIGFYTSVSAGQLRATLLEFRNRFPDMQWRLVGGTRRSILKGVEEGHIDVAIVTTHGLVWPDVSLMLWPERCVAVLPESHRLAGQRIIEWGQLRGERFLTSTVDPGSEITAMIRFHLQRESHHPVIIEHETSLQILKPFVAEGRGILIDCESGTGESLAGLTYRELRHENTPSELRFTACWLRNNPNRALAAFLTLLRERHPDLSAPPERTSPPDDAVS